MSCNLPRVWQEDEWLTENPERISEAQVSVNNYLRGSQELYRGKKILHIGTGNSSIARNLDDVFKQIDGVTNTQQELEAGRKIGSDKYKVYLINKYNPDEFSKLDSDYDVIVDVNLKSYACCQEHWLGFMEAVIGKLKIGGRLISHTAGFGGYSTGFDNSLKMEELYLLLEPNCYLFEMKHLADESGYYPFIIEKI